MPGVQQRSGTDQRDGASYFTNKADESIFSKMQEQGRTLLAEGK